MGLLLVIFVSIIFPPVLLGGFFIVPPRQEIVVLRFGKYTKTITKPGINWIHPTGRELRRISTAVMSTDMKTTTVLEANGNPIQISAVVVWQVSDSYKSAIDVQSYRKFVEDQTGAVVKRVSASFPYESNDGSPCLKAESEEIAAAYIRELQGAVGRAGVEILSVKLNDLTYAPEIAQAMLMRQQAQALVDARETIVEGGVDIVKKAIVRLESEAIHLGDAEKQRLVSNLLVVLCGGQNATPVVQVHADRS